MYDAEIIQILLNPQQNQETNEKQDNDATLISTERQIQLTKEFIKGMKQKPFIDETPHVMAVYKIKELLLN